jgi:hypothetical protein
LLPEKYVRGNISVSNWKNLNPDVSRICAEYYGGLMEKSKKEN